MIYKQCTVIKDTVKHIKKKMLNKIYPNNLCQSICQENYCSNSPVLQQRNEQVRHLVDTTFVIVSRLLLNLLIDYPNYFSKSLKINFHC